MATVNEVIKGFRQNIKEGNPCKLTFDGTWVRLEVGENATPEQSKKCFVGLAHIRSYSAGIVMRKGE